MMLGADASFKVTILFAYWLRSASCGEKDKAVIWVKECLGHVPLEIERRGPSCGVDYILQDPLLVVFLEVRRMALRAAYSVFQSL